MEASEFSVHGINPKLVNVGLLKPHLYTGLYNAPSSTAYEIGGDVYHVREEEEGFAEFEIQETDVHDSRANVNMDQGSQTNENGSMPISVHPTQYGVLINFNILVTDHAWHMIAGGDDMICVACGMDLRDTKPSDHIAREEHLRALEKCKPFEMDPVIREVNGKYHCAVCNTTFETDKSHLETESHTRQVQAATNKADFVLDYIKRNRNYKTDISVDQDQVTGNNSFYDEWNNNEVKGFEEPEYISVTEGGVTARIQHDSWHMIITPSFMSYCMACKIDEEVDDKADHCASKEHLENLSKCTIVHHSEELVIRAVDDMYLHCSHCNNLRMVHDIQKHLELSVGKSKKISLCLPRGFNTSDSAVAVGTPIQYVADSKEESGQPLLNHALFVTSMVNNAPRMYQAGPTPTMSIKVFNRDYKVCVLSFNFIMKRRHDYLCFICGGICTDANLSLHMQSAEHVEKLSKITFIAPVESHIMRQVHQFLHCIFCNVLIYVHIVIYHINDPYHIHLLQKALGSAQPSQQPMAMVGDVAPTDSKTEISEHKVEEKYTQPSTILPKKEKRTARKSSGVTHNNKTPITEMYVKDKSAKIKSNQTRQIEVTEVSKRSLHGFDDGTISNETLEMELTKLFGTEISKKDDKRDGGIETSEVGVNKTYYNGKYLGDENIGKNSNAPETRVTDAYGTENVDVDNRRLIDSLENNTTSLNEESKKELTEVSGKLDNDKNNKTSLKEILEVDRIKASEDKILEDLLENNTTISNVSSEIDATETCEPEQSDKDIKKDRKKPKETREVTKVNHHTHKVREDVHENNRNNTNAALVKTQINEAAKPHNNSESAIPNGAHTKLDVNKKAVSKPNSDRVKETNTDGHDSENPIDKPSEDTEIPANENVLDLEQYVYVRLRNTDANITLAAYNSLVAVGNGCRYCFVCSLQLLSDELRVHVESRSHLKNLDANKFIDKYEKHFIRQTNVTYHCALCNVIIKRRFLADHLSWHAHMENEKQKMYTNTRNGILSKNTKRGEGKNTKRSGNNFELKEIVCATQRETPNPKGGEPKSQIRLNVEFRSNFKCDNEVLRKKKTVKLNGETLRINWEAYQGVSRTKNGYRCHLCQKGFKMADVGVHVETPLHIQHLDANNYQLEYAPALMRKIKDALYCVFCNTEVVNKKALVNKHLRDEKHNRNHEAIKNDSSHAEDGEDVLILRSKH